MLVVEAGQPALEPGHLGLDDAGGHGAQRDDGRGQPGLAAGRQERLDLAGDDGADGLDLAAGLGLLEVAGQVGQGHQGDAGQVGDGRVDVVGQGEVDHGQRPGRGRRRPRG